MNRRTVLQYGALGLGLSVGTVGAQGSQRESNFVQEFGYGVADFFDNDWGVSQLENHVEEGVDISCYAYGELEELGSDEERKISEEPGFLERFQKISLKELNTNPEAYGWVMNHLDDIATLIDYLGVFPDDLGEKLRKISSNLTRFSKFIPLIANVKQFMDSGCIIHDKIQAGKSPSESTYVQFFKHVALTIIEIILLLTGVAASYRVAFGATGWVNQRIINVVGRRIGWSAYSWVLSQIHWGVRVSFAESFGQVISDVTEIVSQKLVSASSDTGNPLSKSEAKKIAESDVTTIADYTEGFGIDYEIWELKQLRKQTIRKSNRRADRISEQLQELLESLSI